MRVTFVLPYAGMSGGIRVPAIYAAFLRDRGHDVTVVSTLPRRVSLYKNVRELLNGRRLQKRLRQQGPSHFDGLGVNWQVLQHRGPILDDDVPESDLVVATWWETAYWVSQLSASKGVKCYFMQDYGAPGQTLEQIVPTWKLGMPMITISQWLEGLIKDHAPESSVRLVSNGVDLEQFYSEHDFAQRRDVGVVYKRLRTKRISLAIDCVQRLRPLHPNLNLRLIGTPKEPVPVFVRPSGRVSDDDVRRIYSSCKAWIFPSKLEGFGLPILEAMACGTPVVATPAGAAPELLASGGGILVDSDDPEVLADAVERVLSMDEASWRAMSRAARAEAEKHSWDVVGDRMEKALLQILEESRSA